MNSPQWRSSGWMQGDKLTFDPSQFSRQKVEMMRIRGDRSLSCSTECHHVQMVALTLEVVGWESERSDLSRADHWQMAGETELLL